MQLTDKDGNIFGTGGLEITTSTGKPKIPVINTDITIGTTTIVGGVAGRVLFEGVGNVVQESPNFLWDNTNGRITVNAITNGAVAIFKNSTNGLTIYPQSTQVQVYSDYFGTGTDKPLIFGTYTNRTNQLSLFTSGNIGVNTATDAGFKFDVAGSIRTQSSLLIANPAFTLGGSITHSANATLVIAGGPGGGENITIGPSNRIFINAQQSRFSNGSVQIASTLSVGVANTTAATMLWTTGGITASSALARGIGLDTTLVAAANNDVLVGLDIAPTFTNGAFTGVSNFAARFGGDAVFTHGNRSIRVLSPTSGSGGSISITSGSATTSGTGGDIYLNVGSGAGGPGPGRIYLGNNNGWDVCYVRGLLTINNSGPNTGSAFQVNAGGQNGFSIFWDNLTPFMQYRLVSARQSRFVNSSSYTFDNNLLIGTNTNAGFRLDVNGTGRFSGSLTINNDMVINSVGDRSITWAVNDLRFIVGTNNIARFFTTGTVFISTVGVATSTGTSIGPTMAGITASSATFSATFFATPQVNHLQTKMLIGGNDGAYGGNVSTQGIGLWIYGGNNTTNNSYGNVVIGHDGTTTRGNVLIGTSTNVASSKLTVESTTQGFLTPRMTNAQMLAIATPATGLMVYDTTNNKLCCYDGTTWQNLF